METGRGRIRKGWTKHWKREVEELEKGRRRIRKARKKNWKRDEE